MVDFGSISSIFLNYTKSGIFILVAIVVIAAIVVFFYGYMGRRSKLKYNVCEWVRFGNGKTGMNQMKAGIFRTKTWLFGLFDYGNESVMKVTDGRVIQGAKTSQLHDIFGKKGFHVIRSPHDNKILVPLSKIEFQNLSALLAVAPGDYRDASTRIFNEAVKETQGTWEKLLPYIAIGVIVVLTIISIVINMQMTNNTVNKVGNMLIQGCSNNQNTKPAGTP